jgi:TolB protein
MRRIATALVFILSVLAGGFSASIWWHNLVSMAGPHWPLVIQQVDGNLLLADEHGHTQPLTLGANGRTHVYRFPTPAPDGRSIASVEIQHGVASASATLIVHRLDGTQNKVYTESGVVPFYLAWSPDSRKIAFLSNTAGGMQLQGVETSGQAQVKTIALGQPSYFSWAPDSQRLLLHIGGDSPQGTLQIYEWGAEQLQQLPLEPGPFQAPIWLPNGEEAFAVVNQPDGAALATIDASGAITNEFSTVETATVFLPSPDASYVAYLSFDGASAGELRLVRTNGTDGRIIGAEAVIAFFWAPTGNTLAFLSLEGDPVPRVALAQQSPRLRWNVLSLNDGNIRSFDSFEPSAEFMNLLPFFDQYAQSIRLWSRDGNRLLYASNAGVHMLNVHSGETQRISDGVLGLWLGQ